MNEHTDFAAHEKVQFICSAAFPNDQVTGIEAFAFYQAFQMRNVDFLKALAELML
jgi:hypothetical protein